LSRPNPSPASLCSLESLGTLVLCFFHLYILRWFSFNLPSRSRHISLHPFLSTTESKSEMFLLRGDFTRLPPGLHASGTPGFFFNCLNRSFWPFFLENSMEVAYDPDQRTWPDPSFSLSPSMAYRASILFPSYL